MDYINELKSMYSEAGQLMKVLLHERWRDADAFLLWDKLWDTQQDIIAELKRLDALN